MASILIILGLVAYLDLELEHMDAKTTLLHRDICEEIYMEQSEGFKVPEKENLVCKLKKSLYGLKQAPREWYKIFDTFMVSKATKKLLQINVFIFKDFHMVILLHCYYIWTTY